MGASKTQTVNIRLICATNADLNAAVEEGIFRKDLLYRINTIEIEIPPLRHRKEDILPLAHAFLKKVAAKYSRPKLTIDNKAEVALCACQWPGNVRELSHVMERAQILRQGNRISVGDLGLTVSVNADLTQSIESSDLRSMEMIEADVIESRLTYFEGNALKTAESLGLSRSAFYRRLDRIKQE